MNDLQTSPLPTMNDQPVKRSSIDESVELEHMLEATSLPPTPAYHQTHHSVSVAGLNFDQGVLAHIITQLRHQLNEVTAERDALKRTPEGTQTSEALQQITEKAERLEEELNMAKKQNHEDAEAIALLRTKVEESRRGLMRLQSENRRQSQHAHPPSALDLSRTTGFHFGGTTPNSSKRASFTPLTGTLNTGGHRRVASIDASPNFDIGSTSPNAQTLTFPDQSSNSTSRRLSGLFNTRRSVSPEVSPEVEALRREVKNLKDTLEETRSELSEAVEAKEASDACARALRQFIEENNVGSAPPSAAVPPSSATPSSAGWGLGKLFRQPSISLDVNSVPNSASAASSPSTVTTSPQVPPLSRKIGSFFASRSNSMSSTASSVQGPLQSSAASAPLRDKRESTYSYSTSDASSVSVAEPVSPVGEEPEPGVHIRNNSDDGARQPEGKTAPSAFPNDVVSV